MQCFCKKQSYYNCFNLTKRFYGYNDVYHQNTQRIFWDGGFSEEKSDIFFKFIPDNRYLAHTCWKFPNWHVLREIRTQYAEAAYMLYSDIHILRSIVVLVCFYRSPCHLKSMLLQLVSCGFGKVSKVIPKSVWADLYFYNILILSLWNTKNFWETRIVPVRIEIKIKETI